MIDFAAAALSALIIAAYHYVLWRRLRRDPLFTVHAMNKVGREMWVDTLMSLPQPDVLAVQTLRNSVMASSFMASTAILLMVGTLTLLGTGDRTLSVWHALNESGATDERTVAWKLICLLIDFFVAFFCFSMAVRFYNHVGYLVAIPPQRGHKIISPALVTAYLNRAGFFYLLGTRSFFYSVPLVFWLFGPLFMLLATVILICALYPLDRAPRASIRRITSGADEPSPLAGAGELAERKRLHEP